MTTDFYFFLRWTMPLKSSHLRESPLCQWPSVVVSTLMPDKIQIHQISCLNIYISNLFPLCWRLQYSCIAIPETWLQYAARWREHPKRSARGLLTPVLHWISTNSLWLWRKNNNWSVHQGPGEGEKRFLEEGNDSLRQIKAEPGKAIRTSS